MEFTSSDHSLASHPADEQEVASLLQRLGRRYLVVLTAVAFLVIVDQALLQPMLVRLSGYAPIINLAGRQRMLSQKITKTAVAIEHAASDRADTLRDVLNSDLAEWDRVHRTLDESHTESVPESPRTEEISAAFDRLELSFARMHAAASQIGQGESHGASAEASASMHDSVLRLLDAEERYLPEMDHIVHLLEARAGEQVSRLRLLGMSLMAAVLALIGGLGCLVVRPASKTIRRQLDDLAASRASLREAHGQLELRVAERTWQLTQSNEALRREMIERQNAEDRTRQLLNQLAHVSRIHTVSHLATGLAHELNQPLGAITNSAETAELLLARESGDTSGLRSAFRRIRDAALRAGAIIRRMRNFLQPAAARERAVVDANMLISDVVEFCDAELRQARISVSRDMSPTPLPVDVDAIQIQQVLVNLIQNAIHAVQGMPEDRRKIVVRSREEGDSVRISLEDSGAGFAVNPEEACHTFYTTRSDGLGLGLAISRSLILDHAGTLTIDSSPGRGAQVQFCLPLSRPDELHHSPRESTAKAPANGLHR